MNAKVQQEPRPVRLVFQLERVDNPRLYDELVQFPQGGKRVNRLRVLAYDGLLVQHGVFSLAAGGTVLVQRRDEVQPGSAAVTNDVFGPSLSE